MSFVAVILFKQPYFRSMQEQNIIYHMYYLPYIDYAVDLPSYASCYRDRFVPTLKKNNSMMAYALWKFRMK